VVSDAKAITKLKKKSSNWLGESSFVRLKNRALQLLPAFCLLWLLRNVFVKGEYRLKRESVKFFRFSSRAYKEKSHRKCDRLLLTALKLIDSSFPLDYLSLLRKSVKCTLNDPSSRSECSKSIVEATKFLDANLFDATGWYQLSRGLFSLGYFRAAYAAR
jgi:hypothetical protein